ncbi:MULTISPECIES: cyclase family protein [unclassified Nocardioides]|uniref:cyclase family protein n=1 Tax=unclassified Nocardioides TaxID=2615069 RepID=UPI0009F08359|nr:MULTISPECIES: cyclase family protein [unclassified Nocardioides]GAW49176.1 cyclase family protein [Nocardioides sp. PD653-B2]GAW55664.1 cyclase family protein [Nocardioides sp. PD653]
MTQTAPSRRADIKVGQSPYGPDDQLGALNSLSEVTRADVLARADASTVYDLSIDYFVGMPSFQAAGDPSYQIYMSHHPGGTAVDNLNGAGEEVNRHVCYSGDVIFMYTHTGTHIDALNHFGVDGKIYNGFTPEEHLGSRHWNKGGAEVIPPMITRGVLVDVATTHGVDCLPDSYAITIEDCQAALERVGLTIEAGDVAFIRTGRMRYWPEGSKVLGNPPGLSLEAARWITGQGISVIASDQECVEVGPSQHEDNWLPGHCHFLAEAGVPMMELCNLEELARDGVNEFALIAAPIRLRGATGSPLRPLALPLRA